jgi:hypothetical protein
MNERIKELWEDSDAIGVCYPEQGSPVSVSAKTLETFAELIVKECIDIAQDRAAFDGFPPNDVNYIIDEIREHFGVEE